VRRSPGLVPAPIPEMRLRKSSRNDRTSPNPLARRSTSPTTLARSQIRFEADPDMRLRSSAARSRGSSSPTARSRKESPVRSLSNQVHVRDRRELREKIEEIKYRLPRFTRIN